MLGASDQIVWLLDKPVSRDINDTSEISFAGGESALLFLDGLRLVAKDFPRAIAHIITDLYPGDSILGEVRSRCTDMAFTVHCIGA